MWLHDGLWDIVQNHEAVGSEALKSFGLIDILLNETKGRARVKWFDRFARQYFGTSGRFHEMRLGQGRY